MLTALRREVQALLADVPARRKPALRRAGSPEALLATDLPLIADDAAVAAFMGALTGAGWRVWLEGGWLLLDHPLPLPPACAVADVPGETGCCLWLLQHHPGGEAPADRLRALAKAAEEQNVEKLCRQWHREFARMLREGVPLPGGLLPYLACAVQTKEERA